MEHKRRAMVVAEHSILKGTEVTYIQPGEGRVVVMTYLYRTIFSNPQLLFAELLGTFQPDRLYQAMAKVQSNLLSVWIEDVQSGQVVSDTRIAPADR